MKINISEIFIHRRKISRHLTTMKREFYYRSYFIVVSILKMSVSTEKLFQKYYAIPIIISERSWLLQQKKSFPRNWMDMGIICCWKDYVNRAYKLRLWLKSKWINYYHFASNKIASHRTHSLCRSTRFVNITL